MSRRALLLLALAALVLGNAIYFWNQFDQDREMQLKAEWLAYSPALENEQRTNPVTILASSEWMDPRYAAIRDKKDLRHNLLVRTAVVCSVKEWSLSTYLTPDPDHPTPETPLQMPDRLFLGAMSPDRQSCVRANLPPGYTVAKLTERRFVGEYDWSAPQIEQLAPNLNRNSKK